MADDHSRRILEELTTHPSRPIKPKALARKLGVPSEEWADFAKALKRLVANGQIEFADKKTVRMATQQSSLVGLFRSIRGGGGFVKPRSGQGIVTGDIFIRAPNTKDAASGDLVLVSLVSSRGADPKKRWRDSPRAGRKQEGRIVEVVERASDRFVGTYLVRNGEAFVRVDGATFHEAIYVGDPGVKGAQEGDKVVFEMLRFPSAEMLGEGVIVEVLGARGSPGVDLLCVIREFHLPDEFSPDALAEARAAARGFDERSVDPNRRDLTQEVTITIDPVDARDFDDAIGCHKDDRGHFHLAVHIADVSAFVPSGSHLDLEARDRGNSVYLPGKVIPMLPELLSNGLASLQENKLRFTKSVFMEFDPEGRLVHVDLANTAIRVDRRFTYEEVLEYFGNADAIPSDARIRKLLNVARELARLLRDRRRARGMLELEMPEPVLEYDPAGQIAGAHYRHGDESHRLIEEFMVTANEAVALEFARREETFLRRIHEIPDPLKLKAFGEFVRSLGLTLAQDQSRFELQRLLREVAKTPLRHAVHYALLRSLKEAIYSPEEEGHWALASDCYCHFTSPIRRYPDLVVHRQLEERFNGGRSSRPASELLLIGEHCSFTERRAARAERELIKVKLLAHLASRVGETWDMIITGVEDFGFFAQATTLPAEGLVHVRGLTDDFYALDRARHCLVGRRQGRQFRLGDPVRCVVWNVDQERRQLDLRLAPSEPSAPTKRTAPAEPATVIEGGSRPRKRAGAGPSDPLPKKSRRTSAEAPKRKKKGAAPGNKKSARKKKGR